MQQYAILLILLINLSLYANEIKSDKLLAQKLFEKAFHKNASDKKLYFPLKINDIIHDEVLVKIDTQENISITKETIEYILSLLKEKYQKRFKYHLEKDNFIPLTTVNQMGIETSYDPDNITINILIPPLLKKSSKIRLNRYRALDLNGSVIPEKYAGGMNFYLNEYYKSSDQEDSIERVPLVLSSDMFLNLNDLVIEGRVNYKEADKKLYRDRIRVIKDDEINQIRYSAGDIFLPNQYRMSYPQVLGISIEKKVELNRDFSQNSSRINSYEFFLKNSSRVEVYINDKQSRVLNLNAGTHNLYDLGIPNGLNQVKLKIIEDNGKIEFISFNDFSYSEVLEKGAIKYGLGAGVISKKEENEFVYNKDEKLLSGYISYGLFDAVTVKNGIQTTQEYQGYALEFIIGTNFGLFNPYIIYSKNSTEQDIKRGLEYRTNIGNFNLNLGYENSGENFTTLDNYKQKQDGETSLYRANIYTPLAFGINLGITASQYTKMEDKEDKIGIRVNKRFWNKLDTRIDFNSLRKSDKSTENLIYATVEYRFKKERLRYTNYIEEKRQILNANHNTQGRYGLSHNLEIDHTDEKDKYYAQANLKDEKFKLDTTYRLTDNKDGHNKNQSLGIQFSTGFVFAGDTATITKPINSSFIIVKNDPKLKEPLGLDGYQDINQHIYSSFALPIGDYTTRELSVDERELDFGIDLEKSTQNFYSNYKSGSVMDIKVQNLYSVKGILIDKKTNQPISNKAFKIFNTELGKKTLGFTNEEGAFTIREVDVGTYNATLLREEQYEGVAKFNFTINNNRTNLIDLGKIEVDMPKKKDIKKYIIFNEKSKST